MTPTLAEQFFHDDGPLAAEFPGYAQRAPQLEMAVAVETALADQSVLVVEAGTGTGKTFAYLVPALQSAKKILIATGTKNLQDQLYHRDLPVIRRLLGKAIKVELLKGRSNYLCLHRLDVNEGSEQLRTITMQSQLRRVRQWLVKSKTGDVAELNDISEQSTLWPQITSTADNCLGQECDHYHQCFLIKARRAAQKADVCVINHHLFFADIALRDNGFGELLPDFDAVIFDEAHQLPAVATQFLGQRMSSRQFDYLVRDVEAALKEEAPDITFDEHPVLLDQLARIQTSLPKEKGSWSEVAHLPTLLTAYQTLIETMSTYAAKLEVVAVRGKALSHAAERAAELLVQAKTLLGAGNDEMVHWYESYRASFSLHATPLTVAKQMRAMVYDSPRSWIFTSATLSVAGDFSHYLQEMGLNLAKSLCLSSPFDFMQQSLVYIPKGLPEPRSPDFTTAQIAAAIPLIKAFAGRTFLLFTSYRALNEAQRLLASALDYDLLVQGSLPKAQLLAEFERREAAVLLGTHSFWEGVDVRGDALSLVVIDKLPFTNPDDPVLQGRMKVLIAQGHSPFQDHQLPKAIISLKQGAGRLIRDATDTGVLMLCDPRLLTKPYGRLFLKSLPVMPLTQELSQVLEYIDKISMSV